jgi:glycine cleavage system H protein
MSTIPKDLQYAKSHEWVRVTGNVATIGVTDHAQHELTDVVFFEPPKSGAQLTAGKPCAVVESVKAASDIYAPISGKVTETNTDLVQHPEWINQAPYEKAWMFKVELSNPAELGALLSADQYQSHIGAK